MERIDYQGSIGGTQKDIHWIDNKGKYIDSIDADFQKLKGWSIGILPVISNEELLARLKPGCVPLIPGNDETGKQWGQWEKELGGSILFLVVPDYRTGKDLNRTGWLVEPVKCEWLTSKTVQELLDLYQARGESPGDLRFRAAIIARTGYPPEIVPYSLRG